MYADEQAAKQKAEKAYYGDTCNAQTPNLAGAVGMGTAIRDWSLADEASKSAQFHFEQADKANRAARFLSAHPEFDEFIRLVRSGAVQF